MSRVCQITGRGPRVTITRSHSMVGSRRRQMINLQTKTIQGVRMHISARVLKKLKQLGIV